MATLQKCCKCKPEQELKYSSNNKKGLLYKTCDACRNKRNKACDQEIVLDAVRILKKATRILETITKEEHPSDTDSVTEDIENKSTTAESTQSDEKYITVLDVETNGLIKQRGATPTYHNLHLFPNIVQFSWGLFHESGECKQMKDYIIKPNGWTMNGKEEYHGIILARANKEGVDIKEVLKEYQHDIENSCSKLVSHNLDFDKLVVKSEFIRHDMIINDIGEYCTMKNSTQYCKLTPRVGGNYKWPKLEQLYQKCFNEELQNAHNSYYDVLNCAKCYFKLSLAERIAKCPRPTQDDKPMIATTRIYRSIKQMIIKKMVPRNELGKRNCYFFFFLMAFFFFLDGGHLASILYPL